MIIRSQDKKTLVNFDRCVSLDIFGSTIRATYEQGDFAIGKYSTEERALAVLDEIQCLYAKYRSVKQTSPGGYSTPSFVYGYEYPKVYEMPPDETEETT